MGATCIRTGGTTLRKAADRKVSCFLYLLFGTDAANHLRNGGIAVYMDICIRCLR